MFIKLFFIIYFDLIKSHHYTSNEILLHLVGEIIETKKNIITLSIK